MPDQSKNPDASKNPAQTKTSGVGNKGENLQPAEGGPSGSGGNLPAQNPSQGAYTATTSDGEHTAQAASRSGLMMREYEESLADKGPWTPVDLQYGHGRANTISNEEPKDKTTQDFYEDLKKIRQENKTDNNDRTEGKENDKQGKK
ncbi:hypothetical protein FGADI_1573 [Fusarium gaditjirri]|uniref:Uncharacterized protein n=1 Tax=Fusarium gaditjirri TaxID=282569 RepID=A0A8H4TKF7_9HYPO|nr:hypothetical protein FGADI_1573 [Fusarium gaditjirri]